MTWRREDGNEIILKDASGTKTHGKFLGIGNEFEILRFSFRFFLAVASFRGETLKLTKIARNEMGSYLCIASNSVPPSVSKRISLNIHCEYWELRNLSSWVDSCQQFSSSYFKGFSKP